MFDCRRFHFFILRRFYNHYIFFQWRHLQCLCTALKDSPCLFYFNKLKAVNLAFCSIKQLFKGDVHEKLVALCRYWKKLRRGYFPILDFSSNLLKTKIFITPETVKILTWNLDHQISLTRETRQRQNIVLTIYVTIVILPIYGWFGAIQNPDSKHMVYNFYIFINSNLSP